LIIPAASPLSLSGTAVSPVGSLTVRTMPRPRPCSSRPGISATADSLETDHQQQEERGEEAEPELDHPGQQLAQVGGEEVLVAEELEVDHRVVRAPLDQQEDRDQQQADGDRDQRPGFPPPFLRALAEAEDQRPDDRREGDDAGQVEFARGVGVGLDLRRGAEGEDDRDHRQRHVDEEDEPPVDRRQHATEDRPERGEERRGAGEDAERRALLLVGIDGADDRERGRHHQRRADPLHGAGGDRHRDVLGGAHRRRRQREDHRADQEDAAHPEEVAEPAAEDHQGRQRQDVRGHQPLRLRDFRVQADDRVRRGERDRGLVDEDHRAGKRHRRQRDLHVPPRNLHLRRQPTSPWAALQGAGWPFRRTPYQGSESAISLSRGAILSRPERSGSATCQSTPTSGSSQAMPASVAGS
jgi:hypothetical protein